MNNFQEGFVNRAKEFGINTKQAQDLLAGAQTNQLFTSQPALHVDRNWKRPSLASMPRKNYMMNPVQVPGTLAENSLNPNAISTPNKTIYVPRLVEEPKPNTVFNKFDFSQKPSPLVATSK